jgi:hypothetical protein
MKEKLSKSKLDGLLADWRNAPDSGETFSDRARERIFSAVRDERTEPAPFATLFVPVRKVLLTAGLPAAALTVLLAVAVLPTPTELDVESVPSLHVRKQGDEVVFVIANGGKPHSVYRSESLETLGTGEPFATADAAFRDRMDGKPGVTYYRID